MLSLPQSLNADSSLDAYDASAAVSTQEEGEYWVQAAARPARKAEPIRLRPCSSKQDCIGSIGQSLSRTHICRLCLSQNCRQVRGCSSTTTAANTLYHLCCMRSLRLASQQDAQLLPHGQSHGKSPKQSALSRGSVDRIAASGDLPAYDVDRSGGHTALQLRSHHTGTLLSGSMPPVESDVVSRGKERREDVTTNIGAAAALEVS